MRVELIFAPDTYPREDIGLLIDNLKCGHKFKFIFDFRVNILKEEIFMILGVAKQYVEHEIIDAFLGEFLRQVPNKGFGIEISPRILGGGYLKMEDGKIIFYDSSQKYGVFNKEYLALGRDAIATLFDVEITDVEFR